MRRERKRLGDLLTEAEVITEDQLEEALEGQSQSGLKLGQYMIRSGLLKESQLIDTLSQQLMIDKYSPDSYQFEEGIDTLISESLAQQHRLVPISKRGHLLVVCMTDPMDINALDTVEIATNLEVEPVICTENDFDMLFSSIYGRGMLPDGVFDSFGADEDESGPSEGDEDISLDSLQEMADQAPVIRMVNSILNQAVREKASDIHISPEKDVVNVRFRVDGKLRNVPSPPKNIFLPLVSRMKIMSNMDISVSKIPQDGRFSFHTQGREFNVRVSSLPTIYGENLVLRLLDRNAHGLTIEELGFSDIDLEKVRTAINQPYGMILAAGPTGSGKSTSLYAILKAIRQDDINIITLEDPVEYRLEKVRQVQLNTKAGMTFASGLRSILRQDPDVVLVGEIRDAETAHIAVQAALTGHRVLSTLHTNDAAGAVTRLVEMGLEPFLVSSVLLVSISQRLVRRNCPHCLEEYEPHPTLIKAFGLHNYKKKMVFKRGAGCRQCHQTGFKGRVALFEILLVDEDTQDMILKGATAVEITRAAVKSRHMRTLKLDATRKALAGVTTLEEAASAIML